MSKIFYNMHNSHFIKLGAKTVQKTVALYINRCQNPGFEEVIDVPNGNK